MFLSGKITKIEPLDQRFGDGMPYEKNFYKDIIDNLYDGVYFVDRDRTITYWNKGAERITGYSAAQTLGRRCRDNLLNHVTANGVQLCMNNCPLAAVMEDGNEREAEVYLHHADGHRVPVIVRGSALRDEEGNIIGAIETFSNNASLIHTRRKLRDLRHAALTDPLTGVGNRRHIEGRLSAALAEFHNNATSAGLLVMDVDRFKKFNDTHGHNLGDDICGCLPIRSATLYAPPTVSAAGAARSSLPSCRMWVTHTPCMPLPKKSGRWSSIRAWMWPARAWP